MQQQLSPKVDRAGESKGLRVKHSKELFEELSLRAGGLFQSIHMVAGKNK